MVSLGIDIGGTGCKCVAFNEEGEQLALAYLEYPLAPGTVDLPPEVMMVYNTSRNSALCW